MDHDISRILEEWPYGDQNLRKIVGPDGREKIQVRVCINTFHGILQFYCDGRPDGSQPHDGAFALDYYAERLQGDEAGTPLTREQVAELFEESAMVYQRYVVLLQIGDFARVIRDAERNMALFRFVHEHAKEEEDRNALEKWWPYILRIHATASALQRLQQKDYAAALETVQEARTRIDGLEPLDDETFQFERDRSTQALDDLQKTIEQQRPLTEVERLERLRDRAVAEEQYETAARLRDQIDNLRKRDQGQ